MKIQEEMHTERVQHEGIGAEEAYADMLSKLSISEGDVQDGNTILTALLARCTLWIEIIREKCALHHHT